MDTDGCCGHDAGIHVDEMYANEESAQVSLRQAEEGIIDPKGKEENKGSISYGQVEHVDVGVSPRIPFGNEDTQSSSIDKETQKKHGTVSESLKQVFITRSIGGVGAHIFL